MGNEPTTEGRITLIDESPAPERRALMANPTPANLIEVALKSGADMDQLERLFAMQERHEANEARKAYVDAMTAFKAEAIVILKSKAVGYWTKENPPQFVGYKHAELSDVCEALIPPLAKHGFAHRWDAVQAGGELEVSCVLTHRLGHSERVTMKGPPDSSGKKNPLQAIASTKTFLERYTFLAVTGTATKGVDDDGEGGADQTDGTVEVDETALDAWREKSLEGVAALKKHYEASVPKDAGSPDGKRFEAFWAKHGPALRDAAKKADADAKVKA